MAYISSDKIKVFPSIGRESTIDADAELMNEGNISNIVRSLCRERKSYVLSKSFTAPFEFVIYGFYFKITDKGALDTLKDRPLYAHITISEATSGNYQLLTLSNPKNSDNPEDDHSIKLDTGTDPGSQFQGVWFNGTKEEGTYTLQLLDESSKVPITSLLHTKTSEILDGDTSNYINTNFTTGNLTVTGSTSLAGLTAGTTTLGSTTISTLTVTGDTKLTGDVIATGKTITASTFVGSLSGNANTASSFSDDRTISLTGAVSGSSTSTNGNHSISTTLASNIVKTDNIADKSVTNEKIADSTIKTAKLGFGITMTLTVNDGILSISLPTLTDK